MMTIHLPSGEKCGNQSLYLSSWVTRSALPQPFSFLAQSARMRQICIWPERTELK